MLYDPTGTISVNLPAGWASDPMSSTLTSFVFSDWRAPSTKNIFIHVYPTHTNPHVPDHDWQAQVRKGLPAIVTRVEYRAPGTLLVERPGSEGRPDQRWGFVRGPRLDVRIKQVDVPRGSLLLTPELAMFLNSIHVSANEKLDPLRPYQEYVTAMNMANRAFQQQNLEETMSRLTMAQIIARQTWLHSLVAFELPEIPAAISLAETTLQMANVKRSVVFLHQAIDMLYRCRGSLRQFPTVNKAMYLKQVDDLMTETIKMHGLFLNKPPPNNPVSACLARCRIAFREAKKLESQKKLRFAGSVAASGVSDAQTALAWIGRGIYSTAPLPPSFVASCVKQGVTDPDAQRNLINQKVEVAALIHLVAMGMLQSATRSAMGRDQERATSENVLFAAQRLAELSPSPEHLQGHILALSNTAAALINIADDPSLTDAQEYLNEAETLLDKLDDPDELRAQILLNQGFLRYMQRIQEGSIELLDRAIEAARQAKSYRIERSALSLRSQFLLLAGRHEEAVRDARAASDAPDDDAASVRHLRLAIALLESGEREPAMREIKAGLAAAIPDEPLGGEVVSLLFVGAQACGAKADSLGAIEAAEAVMDARRIRLGDKEDRRGFEDSFRRREIIGTVVEQKLDADDFLGALATADRHRARSLADRQRSYTGGHRREFPKMPSDKVDFISQVSYLRNYADTYLTNHGAAPPLQGNVLADVIANHNRCTVLFHPSGNRLHIFVVRPGDPILIATAVSPLDFDKILTLSLKLRETLGISVATRSARGELPPQSLDELAAEFADDEIDELDEELNRLCTELHSALFSEIEGLLVDGEPLTIVPYRNLSILPLAVLLDADGVPLSASHPISIVPSIASITTLKPLTLPVKRALVVGDPEVPPGAGLHSLPGAAREAADIAGRLKEQKVQAQLLPGKTATEENVRNAAKGSQILHFACHAALCDPASHSPLYLTPLPPDDGKLLPYEIADLQLDGALVVLSACESGLGHTTADGVHGIGRAFIDAGARTVVQSLWRVSDAATHSLMNAFYSALLGTADSFDGPQDVATSLRYAQEVARTGKWNHPTQWGAWLVVGDGGWRYE